MSYDICGAAWIGKDRKDHTCSEIKHHPGKCKCSCGDSARVVNKVASWEPKPFYKRQRKKKLK